VGISRAEDSNRGAGAILLPCSMKKTILRRGYGHDSGADSIKSQPEMLRGDLDA